MQRISTCRLKPVHPVRSHAARPALLAVVAIGSIAAASSPAGAETIPANLTGIPAYPNLKSATMMGSNPHRCMVYSMQSMDSLDSVVRWYRAHGAGSPVMTKNSYDGMQADFGVHDRKHIVAFTSPRFKNSGVGIALSKNCGHAGT